MLLFEFASGVTRDTVTEKAILASQEGEAEVQINTSSQMKVNSAGPID
jgi:hypothetical protein